MKFYPEVPNVLKTLHKSGYLLGVASRTSEIDGAKELLKLLNWDKYFTYKEIYPGCKVTHFERYNDMIVTIWFMTFSVLVSNRSLV